MASRAGIMLASAGVVYASVRTWKSHASHPTEPSPGLSQSTKALATPPPGEPPEGMVWIPGGEFSMGCEDPSKLDHGGKDAMPDARPIHRVSVDGFWMDRVEVTNRQYAAFVKATGYITVAERTPKAEDFPGARLRISSPVPLCSLLHARQCRSMIITVGGTM